MIPLGTLTTSLSGTITSIQTEMTDLATSVLTAVLTVALAFLVFWAVPRVFRWLKRAVSAGG